MSRVLKDRAVLTETEEEELAAHFYAVEWHVHQILDVLNGRARASWIDYLLKSCNRRALGKLCSALDDDWRHARPSPYYGHSTWPSPVCPCPVTHRSCKEDHT